jgi:hypothetical protein
MATSTSTPTGPEKKMAAHHHADVEGGVGGSNGMLGDEAASLGKGDVLQSEHTDPVLSAKMHLVNNAIDEIGFTRYQWKLYVCFRFCFPSTVVWEGVLIWEEL